MAQAVTILLSLGGFAAGLVLSVWLCARTRTDAAPRGAAAGAPGQLLDQDPAEPCWSEELGRDGARVYARAQCPDRPLMELDERARRGDFPVPFAYG